MFILVHTCVHVHKCSYLFIHVYMSINVHTCSCMCTCSYLFVHDHTCVHVHTCSCVVGLQVKAVVYLLLGNLDTPSQQVQEAIAGCLPPLAPVIKEDASTIIQKLLEKVRGDTCDIILSYDHVFNVM